MALPKIDAPLFDTIIPSTGQKIKIRPFTVKEEKIILLALSSENDTDLENATRQVINNCIVSPKVDVSKLALYDVEFIILQLRARSVGETLTLTFKPVAKTECAKCKKERAVEVDLLSIKIDKNPTHSNKIELRENLGITLIDPSYGLLKDINAVRKSQDFDDVLKVIAKCIEEIWDDNKKYNKKDHSQQEFVDFLESLTKKEFEKIDQFFETLPALRHVVNVDCEACGFHQEYLMEGLKDFLA